MLTDRCRRWERAAKAARSTRPFLVLSVGALGLLGFGLTGRSVAGVPANPIDAHQSASLNGRVIFKDDLGNPKSGWPVASDRFGAAGYTKGGYFIKVTKPHVSETSLAT